MSAMKPKLLAFFLLIVPAVVAAQTPTRERKSDGAIEPRSETSAVRERVVGPKPANHASASKTTPTGTTASQSQTQVTPATNWGNTPVIVRPSQATQSATQVQTFLVKTVADNAEPKKLVQPTALISDSRSSSARTLASTKAISATGLYKVGIGDVLDVRLPSVATRESTLFTVMKNGTLEYPLLSGPVSVAGLTAEEVANLLSKEIKVIRGARVTVSVRDYSSHAVVVSGLVDSPGRKVLRREAMPLYAVLAEAMVRPEATTATLVRNGKENGALPLNNDQALATLVQAGDVIKINGASVSATQFLYVGGAVTSPGEKVFREGMTLTQVLLSAGGATRTDNMVVKIARRNANGFLSTSEYKLRSIEEGKLPDPVVQPGDRIEVGKSM
jgi:protein involved in polysaccharide export with SLBB domain